MFTKTSIIITCPVCKAAGALLRHDPRSSLAYSCQNCLHEWQIESWQEPLVPEFTGTRAGLETSETPQGGAPLVGWRRPAPGYCENPRGTAK